MAAIDYVGGNVDFGVGLEGTASGNLIEDNDIGGNVNGVLVFATTHDNVVRHNIILGNPPVDLGTKDGLHAIRLDSLTASPSSSRKRLEVGNF